MAQYYASANEALKHDEKNPFPRRTFMLLVFASVLTEFIADAETLDAVLKQKRNQEVGRYALRTQIINDPTRPLGGGTEILQFFMEDPNRDEVLRGGHPAVIYEVSGTGKSSAETPLIHLSVAEVDLLAHGEGFSTPLRA